VFPNLRVKRLVEVEDVAARRLFNIKLFSMRGK
jgi:hypothetical protein